LKAIPKMRMSMEVTGIVQASDSHLSVELQRKYGKAQSNLPASEETFLTL
jgi:hypothetical protein